MSFSFDLQLPYLSVVGRAGGLQSQRGRGGNENNFSSGRNQTPVVQSVTSPTVPIELLILYLVHVDKTDITTGD